MSSKSYWFIGGLFVLAILSTTAPRIAGGLVVLLVIMLAIEISQKGLLR